jgi:hypothetical protein
MSYLLLRCINFNKLYNSCVILFIDLEYELYYKFSTNAKYLKIEVIYSNYY